MTQLYISLQESPSHRAAWSTAAERLGVSVIGHIEGANVLPLSNSVSEVLAKVSGLNYMDAETFAILSDAKIRAQHLPAIPAAQTEAEVLSMAGPVFVKPRKNFYKGKSSLAYSRWESAATLHSTAWPEFVASEPALGGLVVCPDMGNPMTNLEIDFAVNQSGQVYVMHTFTHGFTAHNRPTNMVSGATPPSDLVDAIGAFCAQRGVKGGIYNVQAVKHEGTWKVMDWNTRPTGMYSVAAGLHPGVADAGIAHMLGLTAPQAPVHIELRSYWDKNIQNDQAEVVRSFGLTPSWVWDSRFIGRVYGIGDTQEEVKAKFDAFEATLS